MPTDLLRHLTPPAGDRRTWAVLTAAGALSSLAVLPFALGIQGVSLAELNAKRREAGRGPVSAPAIGLLTVAQSSVMFGLVSVLGLRSARGMLLGPAHLRAWLHREPAAMRGEDVALSAGAGSAAAVLTLLVDRTLFARTQEELAAVERRVGVGKALLASLYGAVGEEILMRLGAQTLIVGLLQRGQGNPHTPPGRVSMVPAIILSNLLFGLGHLPVTSTLTRITPGVIVRAVLLNSIVGVPLGLLYWRRGLEAAMIGHGSADLVLHVLPRVTRLGRR